MKVQNIQGENVVQHVSEPLEELFSSLHNSFYETFGKEFSSINSDDSPLSLFLNSIFLPGTLSCLSADKDLIYPSLLLFVNKYAKGDQNGIKLKSLLFISPVAPEELVFRTMASDLRIGINGLQNGALMLQDWPHLVRLAGIIHDSKIYTLNEEPECLRDIVDFHDNALEDTIHLKNVFNSSLDSRIPFGLIIIHSDSESEKNTFNNPECLRRLEELRSLTADFHLSIILTRNVPDQVASIPSDIEKYFDYQMRLQPEANRYTLSVTGRENRLVGKIPLVMIPEIVVMED